MAGALGPTGESPSWWPGPLGALAGVHSPHSLQYLCRSVPLSETLKVAQTWSPALALAGLQPLGLCPDRFDLVALLLGESEG